MQAQLTDGPLKGRVIEVEPVEGRPPATIDVENDDEGAVTLLPLRAGSEGHDGGLQLPLRRLAGGGLQVGAGNPRGTRASAGVSGKPAPACVFYPHRRLDTGRNSSEMRARIMRARRIVGCLEPGPIQLARAHGTTY